MRVYETPKALGDRLWSILMPNEKPVRFAGTGDMHTVYGPVTGTDILKLGSPYWSPVLEGESAIIEVFVPAGASRATP